MDSIQKEQAQQRLDQLRLELEQEIEDLATSAQPVVLDQQAFGRVSRGDALQQQNMAKANLEQCQQRLRDVIHALQKLGEDHSAEYEYGYCEACDEMISIARIEARPDSRFCLKCQQDQES